MRTSKDFWEHRFDDLDAATYDFSKSKPLDELADYCHNHLHPGSLVLDLACGGGRNAHYLASQDYTVWGMDFSESAIEFCRKRFSRFNLTGTFKVGTMDHIPLSSRSFDGVVCIAAIDHVSFETAQKVIPEIRRVLKPEGAMLLTFDPVDADEDIIDQAEVMEDETRVLVRGEYQGLIFHRYTDDKIKILVGDGNIDAFEYLKDGSRLIISK